MAKLSWDAVFARRAVWEDVSKFQSPLSSDGQSAQEQVGWQTAFRVGLKDELCFVKGQEEICR